MKMQEHAFLLKSLTSVFVILCLMACNPRQSALDHLQEFTLDLDKNHSSYSNEQWDNALLNYEEIVSKVESYSDQYTPNEKETIGRLQGKCEVIFTKHAIEDEVGTFMQDLHKYKGMFEGVIEELQESLK